ncbi:hypothetical protein MNBD_ALPHA03-211 [hydrothermal vent metagenome]|uniref:Glycosyltransferase n=1 Tax=hydrothermal vent metagenome TaxID=652676 RepID=A0A3B1ANS5_9ZZZZ
MDNASGKRPIIALDHTSWDGNWMNRQHILSRLGERGWPVVYSNGAKFYNEISLLKPFGSVEKKDNVAVYHSGFFLPRNYKFKTLDRLAIKQHCKDLKKKAGLKKGDDFITFCFHPDFYPYVEELDAPHVMFHIYDLFHKFSNTEKKNSNIEKLINKADLITSATEVVWNETVKTKNLEPNIIYNAVDFSLFSKKSYYKGSAFNLIEKLPSPRVGYLGALNRKLDFDILDKLANRFPAVQFVMIGPKGTASFSKDGALYKAYQSFFAQENVHHVGSIKKEEIPGCIDLMDVTIAPYIMDKSAWAYAAYPLKINEYLAAGKPVVSASSPSMVQYFDDIVVNCNTADEWEDALKDALSGQGKGTFKSRIEFAKSNDWSVRVDKLEKLMFQMLENKYP